MIQTGNFAKLFCGYGFCVQIEGGKYAGILWGDRDAAGVKLQKTGMFLFGKF